LVVVPVPLADGVDGGARAAHPATTTGMVRCYGDAVCVPLARPVVEPAGRIAAAGGKEGREEQGEMRGSSQNGGHGDSRPCLRQRRINAAGVEDAGVGTMDGVHAIHPWFRTVVKA